MFTKPFPAYYHCYVCSDIAELGLYHNVQDPFRGPRKIEADFTWDQREACLDGQSIPGQDCKD